MLEEENPGDSTPTWWIDKDVPGTGDRPEWLADKFKSVADMATSYSELEKKISSMPNAPESYDFSKHESVFKKDHPAMKELQDFYKENKITQDVLDKTFSSILEYTKIDEAAEKAKLGEDADARIKELNNWAESNFSQDTFKALTDNMVTVDAIKAMEEVRKKMVDNIQSPPKDGTGASEAVDRKAVEDEMYANYEKYQTDAAYRQQMDRKLEALARQEGVVDKRLG